MFTLKETKKSIGQAVFVVGFERDATIRTRQFEIEKAFASLIHGPSVNTNMPDDHPPQAPRVMLGQHQVTAIFSQVMAQLTISVDNSNDKSLETITASITKKINLFQDCLDTIVPRGQQRERGLVLTVIYPLDSTKFPDEVVFRYIQDNFLKVEPRGMPASAQFTAGYRTDDNYFFTLTLAQYKKFKSEITPHDISTTQFIDIMSLPVVESGLELKVDVNSRPLLNNVAQPEDVTRTILKKAFDFVLSEADTFMGAT